MIPNDRIERLVILIEECAEAIQTTAKVLRHEWTAVKNGIEYDNRSDLEKEIGHIQNAIQILVDNKDVNIAEILLSKSIKKEDIKQYLRYQK